VNAPALLFPTAPMVDPVSGFRAWFIDANFTAVTQATGPMMSKAAANFLIGPFDAEVKRRWINHKVRFVHDWRTLSTYEPETRGMLIDWARGNEAMTAYGGIALSDRASIFARIALTTAVGALRVFRVNVESLDDRINQVIAELATLPNP
jgi:hypothetical protein